MTGPRHHQTIPFLPGYIPQDVDMTAVKAEVAALSVSAPAAAGTCSGGPALATRASISRSCCSTIAAQRHTAA